MERNHQIPLAPESQSGLANRWSKTEEAHLFEERELNVREKYPYPEMCSPAQGVPQPAIYPSVIFQLYTWPGSSLQITRFHHINLPQMMSLC